MTPELITETSFVSTEQESLTSVDISKTNPSTTTTTITNDVTNTTTTTAICKFQVINTVRFKTKIKLFHSSVAVALHITANLCKIAVH